MKAKLVEHHTYREDRRYKDNFSLSMTFLSEDGFRFEVRQHVGSSKAVEAYILGASEITVGFVCRLSFDYKNEASAYFVYTIANEYAPLTKTEALAKAVSAAHESLDEEQKRLNSKRESLKQLTLGEVK